MDTYLLVLHVTCEQEKAIHTLFIQHGWTFYKSELSSFTKPQFGCNGDSQILPNWGQSPAETDSGFRDQVNVPPWQNTAGEDPGVPMSEQPDATDWGFNGTSLGEAPTAFCGSEEFVSQVNSKQYEAVEVQQTTAADYTDGKLDETPSNDFKTEDDYKLLELQSGLGDDPSRDRKESGVDIVDQATDEIANEDSAYKDSEVLGGIKSQAKTEKISSRAAIKLKIEKGKLLFQEKKRRQREKNANTENFSNNAVKSEHRNNTNSSVRKKKKIHCNDCNVTFTSQRRFDGHKERNGGKCVFVCEYCGKVFLYRRSKYLLHIRSAHTKERPFVCQICQKGYVTSDKLKIHMRTHTGEKPCVCEQCGRSFYSRAELSIHKDYHHVSLEQRDEFRCDVCNITFCSKRYLLYHKNVTHSNSWDFLCTKCNKRFKCNTALQRHLKYIHTDIRNFKCEVCGKTFKSPACLRKHVIRHGGEKTFFCTECDKSFYEKAKLAQHVRIHTGEKPYQCDMCDYKCALAGNLTKHRKTHYKTL